MLAPRPFLKMQCFSAPPWEVQPACCPGRLYLPCSVTKIGTRIFHNQAEAVQVIDVISMRPLLSAEFRDGGFAHFVAKSFVAQ